MLRRNRSTPSKRTPKPGRSADPGLTQKMDPGSRQSSEPAGRPGGSPSDAICIGDDICLYCKESVGYMFNYQSSSVHNQLNVYEIQSEGHPEDVPDPYAITFRICARNRYRMGKQLEKWTAEVAKSPGNPHLQSRLQKAQDDAAEEKEENEAEQQRQFGKKLRYGQVIQLRHLYTQKYVHVSTTQTSLRDKNNMMVSLQEGNSKHVQFRIIPRFKVKSEGDIVQVDDQVVLESIKSAGQYLHSSATGQIDNFVSGCEVNSGVYPTGFSITRFRQAHDAEPNLVRSGSCIRFFHKEIEAYLSAEGMFCQPFMEDVHLRIRRSDKAETRPVSPSTSAITYWQIEPESSMLDGGVILWKQQVRFRHMTTRRYLSLLADGQMTLVDNGTDPMTVFRLHPVIRTRNEVELETYARVEHVLSRRWIHGEKDVEYIKGRNDVNNPVSATQQLRWDGATLRQAYASQSTQFLVKAVTELKYDDAFTIQKVNDDGVAHFRFIAGVMPCVQNLLHDIMNNQSLEAKRLRTIITAFEELKSYLFVNGVATKERQKLMRNLMFVDLVVQFLKMDTIRTGSEETLTQLQAVTYDLLETYLQGDSRKNELYIAKYIGFFITKFSEKTEIGQRSTTMITELLRDNRKVLDRISNPHIEGFVQLVKARKNYRYLDLLGVLCVCDGVALPANQTFIAQKWLEGDQAGVILTEDGERIDRHPGVMYVSMDSGTRWTSLQQFCKQRTDEAKETYLFLERQLDLFGKLCMGRNSYCIDVITKRRNYLTWNEALLSLTDEHLPAALRAKYCGLIIGMFVDVGNNRPVLDQLNLTFIYSELDSEDILEKHAQNMSTDSIFPPLLKWLNKFFDDNKDMTASEIGQNKLIEQVLRLLHYLVSYGYYSDAKDIKALLVPLLSLLDGKNDKPFKITRNRGPVSFQGKVRAVHDHTDWYQESGRFQKAKEANAICNAKYCAMEVVELIMDLEHKICLKKLLTLYKKNDGRGSTWRMKSLIKELKQIMDSSHFKEFKEFVNILMDLSNYNYSKMVIKSIGLLNRYHTGYQDLFEKAVQAQVLINTSSVRVHRKIMAELPALRRLRAVQILEDQGPAICRTLQEFTELCHLPREPDEPHATNQLILVNNGILDIIFNLLSQELDVDLMAQYETFREVLRTSLVLLKFLIKGNKAVQEKVFGHLDRLLTIRGVEADLGGALLEIFTGNESTCMRVQRYQIQTIMQRTAELRENASEFLDLLAAIVKIEERDLPLKRNQALVMGALMGNYHQVAHIFEQPIDARQRILRNEGDAKELSYLISLTDVLASCAEGENPIIESQCQTALGLKELIAILNDPLIDNNLKRPFMRFLLWAYLYTGIPIVESGIGDLLTELRPWMSHFVEHTKEVTTWVGENPEEASRLLKRSPPKSAVSDTPNGQACGTLHFIFDAAFPFLREFYRRGLQVNSGDLRRISTSIARALLDFAKVVAPLLSISNQNNGMIKAIQSVLSNSDIDPQEVKSFLYRHGDRELKRAISLAQETYTNDYQTELELNSTLNEFAGRLHREYQGSNTVAVQLGVKNNNRAYMDEGGYEVLPLGNEFQDMVKTFIIYGNKNALKRTDRLIEALYISATQLSPKEQMAPAQISLDIKCLQILRAVIHNLERRLPENWETTKSRESEKLLSRICNVQNALNSNDAIVRTMPLIGRHDDQIFGQYLAFLAAMFVNVNTISQSAMEKYFLGTREELFFYVIKRRMQEAVTATKEKRSLVAQDELRQQNDKAQSRTLVASLTGTDPSEQIRLQGQKIQQEQLRNGVPAMAQPLDRGNREIIQENAIPREAPEDQRDVYGIQLLFKVLASMCDGQNQMLQDYLREQPDNIKSVDLVAESTDYLNLLYARLDNNNINLVTQIFSTLNEFASGNPANHQVLFDHDIIEYVNFILRQSDFPGVTEKDVIKLHHIIGCLLMSLVEENNPATDRLVKEVAGVIDIHAVRNVAVNLYIMHKKPVKKGGYTTSVREQIVNVGFKYHFILERLKIIGEESTKRAKTLSKKDLEAVSFYSSNSMTAEVITSGGLQRVHFRVRDEKVFREEVKEQLKWNVDRSTASNKLRDLLEWSTDIIDDIYYQRRIRSAVVIDLLIRGWTVWNTLVLLLSLVINIFMIATWDSRGALGKTNLTNAVILPDSINDPRPLTPGYYKPVLWSLGILHNALSLVVCLVYMLSNRPMVPTTASVRDWFTSRLRRDVRQKTSQRRSKLRTNLISFLTFYYLVFVAMSLCGTAFYGYFFAFHLLNIVYNNNLLQRVIRAVTQNGKSLLWVAILGLFVLYIFTLVAFALMRASMDPSPDAEQTLYCITLYQCLVTVIRFGLLGELFEFMRPHDLALSFQTFGLNAIFHVAFFIIITTIGLNIVFGIILDTFSELRATKFEAETDMRMKCFICSRSSFEFDRDATGFEYHVKKEHNMWAYIFFLIHLKETAENDYTNIEQHVHKLVREGNLGFFPVGQAMSLANEEDDWTQAKIRELLAKVNSLIENQTEQAFERQRKQEKAHQERWEAQHHGMAAMLLGMTSSNEDDTEAANQRLTITEDGAQYE